MEKIESRKQKMKFKNYLISKVKGAIVALFFLSKNVYVKSMVLVKQLHYGERCFRK